MSLILGGQEEEEPPAARQNPILRAHFRRQLANMGSFRSSRRVRNDPFLEDYIDRQIDHYLSELREKLTDLNSHFSALEQARKRVLQGASPQAVAQARVDWRNTLKEVQDKAGDLWNMLRYVLTPLKDKRDLKSLGPLEPGSLFEIETRFIGEQIEKADQRITEYFFQAESVIQLEDLQGENMLIHLYVAREMAKKIREMSR